MADARDAPGSVKVERLTARITGRVQGVGFRWWAQRQAEALGIVGWVMNADDERSVELVAEGEDPALNELLRRLEIGPAGARVDAVEAQRGPASGEFHRFGIMRS
jgi:acylphosphatase